MKINRTAIKGNAKYAMNQADPNVLLVTLAYLLVNFVLNLLYTEISWQGLLMDLVVSGQPDYVINRALMSISPFAYPLGLALSVMSQVISSGYALYMLNVSRELPASYGNLFDVFSMFFRIVALNILMMIFIFLWAMPFVIPGIVAAYRYRMATFLLLDNPDMSPLDCIRLSKQMMDGRKGELFVLDFSFLGWAIAFSIPEMILQQFMTVGVFSEFANVPSIGGITPSFVVISLVSTISSIWLIPYRNVTSANFYNALLSLNDDFRPPFME